MKSVQVELSDKLASEIDSLVKEGWFKDETEIIHLALIEFIRGHRFELLEQYQRDDIAWALNWKEE